jgi:hypothetical protein
LKGLLYEAYHKSSRELLYVVPFTAKVVESCAKSKVGPQYLELTSIYIKCPNSESI